MCLELFVEVARGRVRERGGGDARGQLGDAYGRFGVEALNGDLVHVGDFGGRARWGIVLHVDVKAGALEFGEERSGAKLEEVTRHDQETVEEQIFLGLEN